MKKWNENEEYRKYWQENLLKRIDDINESQDIVKGFGNKLLTKVNAFVDEHIGEEKFINKNINNYVWSIWNEIGKTIYSYGCAKPRKIC